VTGAGVSCGRGTRPTQATSLETKLLRLPEPLALTSVTRLLTAWTFCAITPSKFGLCFFSKGAREMRSRARGNHGGWGSLMGQLLFGGLAVGAIGVGLVALLGASSPAPLTLDPAIRASLASNGTFVSALPTTNVPLKREQAEAVAIRKSHDPTRTTISTATLANVTEPGRGFQCICWVISYLGTGGPLGGPPGTDRKAILDRLSKSYTRYNVTFIDAQSGKYLFEVQSYILRSPVVSP